MRNSLWFCKLTFRTLGKKKKKQYNLREKLECSFFFKATTNIEENRTSYQSISIKLTRFIFSFVPQFRAV